MQRVPCGVKGSYSWAFVLNDSRRVSLLGRQGNPRTERLCTGITMRAFRIARLQAGVTNATFPMLAAEDRTDEPAEDDEEGDEGEPREQHGDLLLSAKEWQGWRLAYRVTEPEKHDEGKTIAKLARRHRLLGQQALATLAPGLRHRSAAQLQAAFCAARAKRQGQLGDQPVGEQAAGES